MQCLMIFWGTLELRLPPGTFKFLPGSFVLLIQGLIARSAEPKLLQMQESFTLSLHPAAVATQPKRLLAQPECR